MEDKESEETCGDKFLKHAVDAAAQQHEPMKMIDGCNSLATAKSARTSFSPSPTCEGADRKGQRHEALVPNIEAERCSYVFGGQTGSTDVEERRIRLCCDGFGLEEPAIIIINKAESDVVKCDGWKNRPALFSHSLEAQIIASHVLEL